jgi:hypothetical protein
MQNIVRADLIKLKAAWRVIIGQIGSHAPSPQPSPARGEGEKIDAASLK